jgi:outer membrane protein TolC
MRWGLIFILLFCTAFSFAEQTRTITIFNAVEMALNNNLDLRQAEKNVLIAEAQYGESLADFWLPGISLNGSYTLIDPLTVSNSIAYSSTYAATPAGIVYPISMSQLSNAFPNNYSMGVTISKALFLGFRNLDAMEIKEINLELAKKQYEDEKEAIKYSTETAFYTLILDEENIKLTTDLDRLLSNQLISSRINYQEGISSQYDYVSVEVQYMNNLPKVIQAKNAFKVGLITLCYLIGIKDTSNVTFIGNLMDYTNIIFTNTNEYDIMTNVYSNSIGLMEIDAALKTLTYTKGINDANYDPSLSAFFNYQYNYKRYFEDTTENWWPSWNVGLQLSLSVDSWIPISRPMKTDIEYDETIKKTLLSRESFIESLTVQVDTLLLQLDQSLQNLVSQKEGLRLSQIGLNIASQQFAAGQASSLDLINAETAYTQASQNYLQAIFDYFSSTLQLKRLMNE